MVMPFRLHGAAATFQQLVGTILSPCKRFTSAYLDNIVIYSKNWEDHQCLQAAGLKISPKKRKLGFAELDDLGCHWKWSSKTSGEKGNGHIGNHLLPNKETDATVLGTHWQL